MHGSYAKPGACAARSSSGRTSASSSAATRITASRASAATPAGTTTCSRTRARRATSARAATRSACSGTASGSRRTSLSLLATGSTCSPCRGSCARFYRPAPGVAGRTVPHRGPVACRGMRRSGAGYASGADPVRAELRGLGELQPARARAGRGRSVPSGWTVRAPSRGSRRASCGRFSARGARVSGREGRHFRGPAHQASRLALQRVLGAQPSAGGGGEGAQELLAGEGDAVAGEVALQEGVEVGHSSDDCRVGQRPTVWITP